MSRWIDADRVIDIITRPSIMRKSDMIYAIKRLTIIDAVSVVHGEWIVSYTGGIKQTECSACGKSFTTYDVYGWNYCPWCGCQMKGANDE